MTLIPRQSNIDMWRRYLEGKLGGESPLELVSKARFALKKQGNIKGGGPALGSKKRKAKSKKNIKAKSKRKTSTHTTGPRTSNTKNQVSNKKHNRKGKGKATKKGKPRGKKCISLCKSEALWQK